MGWTQTLAGRLWASGDTEPAGECGPDLARWLLPSGAAESQVRGQVRSVPGLEPLGGQGALAR